MARANHEAPPVPKSKGRGKLEFDLSDVEAVQAPKLNPKKAPPVPLEAMRPKRAKKRPVASEGRLKAEAAGEIMNDDQILDVEASQIESAEPVSLRMETQRLGDAFAAAKADFEQVADAIDQRTKLISEWAAGEAEAKGVDVAELIDQVLTREGLQEYLDESMDKMIAARKAFVESHERWEAELLEDEQRARELDELVAAFRKEAQPAPDLSDLLPRRSPEDEEEARKLAAYNLAHPVLSEVEVETASKAAAEQDDREARAHEARLNAEAKPLDRFEEAAWFGEGEKASRDEQRIADVRQEIAGNELEHPVGTPADLSALGFDKVFIDAYNETQERFDKIDEQKSKAGFFKKLFGGARLAREHEAARSDLQSMQEEVAHRRHSRQRAVQESAMTPAQLEAKRASDEIKIKGIISRGH